MSDKCLNCGGRGFIEAPLLMSAGNFGTLRQCCDIKKYSAEVARRINGAARKIDNDENKARRELGHNDEMGKVIPLKRREHQ